MFIHFMKMSIFILAVLNNYTKGYVTTHTSREIKYTEIIIPQSAVLSSINMCAYNRRSEIK